VTTGTVVSIGSFDGVHLGHQELIRRMNTIAKQHNLRSVIVSFSPHPRIFFNPETDLKLLTTDSEKTTLLSKTGLNDFIIQDFNRDFANQSPDEFIHLLVKQLKMKDLYMGYDHHFGKNRKGSFAYIQSLESRYNFKTHQIDAVVKNEKNISSTIIRKALHNGDISLANSYLGYEYFITGEVVSGNKLGRQLGFPTANISVKNSYKLIPKQGVYVVYAEIDKQKVFGMMNIGFRPTINGKKQIKEVHFFDFNQEIYGQKIKVHFIKRLRDEQKFSSLEALQKQLQKDEIHARNEIQNYLNS
jgi:riboflavin kinase/FMN adenylyltransferase